MSPTLTSQGSRFSDRRAAGRELVASLTGYRDARPVVVGLAPNGMPIAAEIAHMLRAPLEAVAIEPLTLGPAATDRFGIAAENGIALFDPNRREVVEANPEAVDAILVDAEAHLRRQAACWHDGLRRQSLRGRIVLLVAELLVDERQAAAAACAVRDRGATNVVFVVPRARLAAVRAVEQDWVDEIVGLDLTDDEITSESCFVDSSPVSDETIQALLRENRNELRRVQRRRAH